MAIKGFVFMENWVSSKVARTKTAFLTQPGATFWPQKTQINNSFRSILVKKDRDCIIISFVA